MRRCDYLIPLGSVAAAITVVVSGGVRPPAVWAVADVTGLIGAFAAAAAFAWTGWYRHAAWRWPMALGLAGWGCGQAIWTWDRTVGGRAMTFPDLENVLFLALPICVFVALVSAARRTGGGGDAATPTRVLVLDAVLISLGLVALTWETTIGAAPAATASTTGKLEFASIYALADLSLICLALVFAIGLRSMWRRPLAWLVAGLVAIGFSDACYAYNISAEGAAPTWADAGYMAGPALLFVAAITPDRPFRRRHDVMPLLFLPYLPLTAVLIVTLLHASTSPHGPRPAETYILVTTVAVVVVRQLVSQTQLYAAHRELRHRAAHDPLTGAANRTGLAEAYQRALTAHTDEPGHQLGLLLLDLNGFKALNDTHGHDAGDEALRETARRLRICVRPSDTVARLGGDEFVILLDPAPDQPHQLARRIRDALAHPMLVDGHHWKIAASTGHSVLRPGDDLRAAIAAADSAMYAAKSRNRPAPDNVAG